MLEGVQMDVTSILEGVRMDTLVPPAPGRIKQIMKGVKQIL